MSESDHRSADSPLDLVSEQTRESPENGPSLEAISSKIVEIASRGQLPSCCPVSPDSSSGSSVNQSQTHQSNHSGQISPPTSSKAGGLSQMSENGTESSIPLTNASSLSQLPTFAQPNQAVIKEEHPRANSTIPGFQRFPDAGVTVMPGTGSLGSPLSSSSSNGVGGGGSAFRPIGEMDQKPHGGLMASQSGGNLLQNHFLFGAQSAAAGKRPLSANISLPPSLSSPAMAATQRALLDLKSPLIECPPLPGLFPQLGPTQTDSNGQNIPPDFNFNRAQLAAVAHQQKMAQLNGILGPGSSQNHIFSMMQAVAANNFILRQQQQHQSKNPGMIGSQTGPLPSSLGPAGAANAALMTSFLQQLQAAGQQPGGSPGVAPFMPSNPHHNSAAVATSNSMDLSLNGTQSAVQARLCRDILASQLQNANGSRNGQNNNGNDGDSQMNGTELCVVCGDKASGRHYGAISCEGCKGFFKRSIRKQTLKNQILQIAYVCRGAKDCPVTKFHRNRCQFCRLRKCLSMGMKSESVQAERRPMNAALAAAASAVAQMGSGSPSSAKYAKMNNGMGLPSSGNQSTPMTTSAALCRSTSVNSSVGNSVQYSGSRISPPIMSTNQYLQQGLLAIVQQQNQNQNQASGPSVSDFLMQLNQNHTISGPISFSSSITSTTTNSTTTSSSSNSKIKLERKYSSDATSTTTTTLDICGGADGNGHGRPASGSASPTTPASPTAPVGTTTPTRSENGNSGCPHSEYDPDCCCQLMTAATTSSAAPSPISSGSIARNELNRTESEDEPTSPTGSSNSDLSLQRSVSCFPLFSAERAIFELPIPQPQPQELNIQFICETASRLLFLSVHWIKNVRALAVKPFYLESTMKSKWCDVFVLGLMQCADEFRLPNMLNAMNNHLSTCAKFGQLKAEKYEEVNKQINHLLTFVNRTRSHKLSSVEYAYLKAIAFTSNDLPNNDQNSEEPASSAQQQHQISHFGRQLNVQACQELYDHILVNVKKGDSNGANMTNERANIAAVERFSQLLQLLPCLRWFKQSVLVELFFSGLIGSLSIETVMPFILSMDVMQIFDNKNNNLPNGQMASGQAGAAMQNLSCGNGRSLLEQQQQNLLALATNTATAGIKNF